MFLTHHSKLYINKSIILNIHNKIYLFTKIDLKKMSIKYLKIILLKYQIQKTFNFFKILNKIMLKILILHIYMI